MRRPGETDLPKYHIDSIQEWPEFTHAGQTYSLNHLDCHEVIYQGQKASYKFVVTYGLHCFTKNDTGHNIGHEYEDGRESQQVCMERYEASKQLRSIITQLGQVGTLYQTEGQKYFTIDLQDSAANTPEPYKVCVAIFKENRLMRIHVTSAFFARTGEGSVGHPVQKKGFSIFKVALDTQKKPNNGDFPKEARNRKK